MFENMLKYGLKQQTKGYLFFIGLNHFYIIFKMIVKVFFNIYGAFSGFQLTNDFKVSLI